MVLNRTLNGLMLLFVVQVILFSLYYLFENRAIKTTKVMQEEQQLHALALWHKVSQSKEYKVSYVSPLEPKVSKSPFRVISPKGLEDIIPLKDQLVPPVLYTNSIPLDRLSIEQKKEAFISMMLPSILLAKYKIRLERVKLLKLSVKSYWSEADRKWLKEKRESYHAKDYVQLYQAMELHPTSLILAQAIVESGWGTSKFFQKANNVFGVWSFDPKDNRIAASEKRGKKRIYLKKYETLVESIHDYLLTISRHQSYQKFRQKRLKSQDPFVLVNYLDKYSEQGDAYIKNLKNIIKSNNLARYDRYRLAL